MDFNLKQLISKKLVRNISSNYLGFAVNTLIVLFITPFLIHHIGSTQYGIWVLLVTLLSYFQLLELGMMPAIIRYTSHHKAKNEPDQIESIIGSAICLLLALSVVTLPIIFLTSNLSPSIFSIENSDKIVFVKSVWLVGIIAIIAFFKRLFYAVHEGYQRFDLLNLCTTSGNIAGALTTVYFVSNGHGILALIAILLMQTLYETLFEMFNIIHIFKIKLNPFKATRESIKTITNFSFYSFLTDIAITISHRIDTVVIGIFLPLNTITHYTIGIKISGILEKITDPLIDIFFPLASDLHSCQNKEKLQLLFLEGSKISVLMITPGIVIGACYGADIIGWWVGEQFIEPSLPILQIFLGVVFLAVFESTSSRILLGTGNVRFDAMVSGCAAVLNVILSVILVKKYGVIGVALGTLLPTILTNLIVSVSYTCKITGTSIYKFYFSVLTPVVIIAISSLVFMSLTRPLFSATQTITGFIIHSIFVCVLTILVYLNMGKKTLMGYQT